MEEGEHGGWVDDGVGIWRDLFDRGMSCDQNPGSNSEDGLFEDYSSLAMNWYFVGIFVCRCSDDGVIEVQEAKANLGS